MKNIITKFFDMRLKDKKQYFLLMLLLLLIPACADVNYGDGLNSDLLEVTDEEGRIVEQLDFSEEGGEVSLNMLSRGKGWLVVRAYAHPGGEWVKVTPEVSKAGRTNATISVTKNTTSPTTREAIYEFRSGDIKHEVKITQPATLVVIPNDIDYEQLDFDMVKLTASWDYQGEEEVTVSEFGFCWREYGETEWNKVEGTAIDDPEQARSFEVTITGLSGDQAYEYMAYVVSEQRGEVFSPVLVLETLETPEQKRISEVRADYLGVNFVYDQPTMLNCIVVSDVGGGNLPSNSFFAIDAVTPTEPGNGVLVQIDDGATFEVGDLIDIVVTDAFIGHFENLPPVLTIQNPVRIIKQGTKEVVPISISAPSALLDYESMLVSVANTQLLSLFTNTTNYPSWSSAPAMMMEVAGETDSYNISVKESASFASDTPIKGSGTLVGVVSTDADGFDAFVLPRNAKDVSLLTEPRFTSLLSLQFTEMEIDGSLFKGMKSSAKLILSYVNGANEVIDGTDIAIAVGGIGGLTVAPDASYTIGVGSGQIEIPIKGVPEDEGSVEFTVIKIADYIIPSPATINTVVIAPSVSDFNIKWMKPTQNSRTDPASPTNLLVTEENSAFVVATDIAGNQTWGSTRNWRNVYGGVVNPNNSEVNAEHCLEFKLTVNAVSANISGIYIPFTLKEKVEGEVYAYVRYKINNVEYVTCATLVTTGAGTGTEELGTLEEPFDLSNEVALQGLSQSDVVTFHIIPIKGGVGEFAIDGDAQNSYLLGSYLN